MTPDNPGDCSRSCSEKAERNSRAVTASRVTANKVMVSNKVTADINSKDILHKATSNWAIHSRGTVVGTEGDLATVNNMDSSHQESLVWVLAPVPLWDWEADCWAVCC